MNCVVTRNKIVLNIVKWHHTRKHIKYTWLNTKFQKQKTIHQVLPNRPNNNERHNLINGDQAIMMAWQQNRCECEVPRGHTMTERWTIMILHKWMWAKRQGVTTVSANKPPSDDTKVNNYDSSLMNVSQKERHNNTEKAHNSNGDHSNTFIMQKR